MFNKLTTAFAVGSFAVSTAIAGTLITAPAADAKACFDVGQYGMICNSYRHSNRHGDVYVLGFGTNNGHQESMTVVCNGSRLVDYRSRGTLSPLAAQTLAKYFCSY